MCYLKNCIYFWKILVLCLLIIVSTYAECNVCQRNEAACINTTSFHLCFGENQPNTDVLYHCKDGFDCTDLNAICVQASNTRKPSCGDTSQCGLCSAHRNYLFACTSATTFRMCYGATHPSGQIGYCPKDFICDADSDAICVSETQPHKVTCAITEPPVTPTSSTSKTEQTERDVSTTMSTTLPTTVETTSPNSIPKTPNEVCAEIRQVGLFPAVPNDHRCMRFIYCYFNNGVIRGLEQSCAIGSYFDAEREQCTLRKPPNCL